MAEARPKAMAIKTTLFILLERMYRFSNERMDCGRTLKSYLCSAKTVIRESDKKRSGKEKNAHVGRRMVFICKKRPTAPGPFIHSSPPLPLSLSLSSHPLAGVGRWAWVGDPYSDLIVCLSFALVWGAIEQGFTPMSEMSRWI